MRIHGFSVVRAAWRAWQGVWIALWRAIARGDALPADHAGRWL
jgi:hypothetical protein